MDAKPDISGLPALARERVRIGPVPDWVSPTSYNPDFDPQVRGSTTCLLIEEQLHAELGGTYTRVAMRLETMQAVQLHSQWRLEFEPQAQSVVLHCIKVRRGASETEHGVMGLIQFLQREAELEGFSIDGWITLLLLLEDVRTDDILEWSYTVTSRPRLLPMHVSRFFSLPIGTEVGKYYFSVRHAEPRGLKWKSSAPELAPKITTEGTEIIWLWSGESISTPEQECYAPLWQLTFPWVQVSDCADWQTVARAISEGWEEVTCDGLRRFVEEIQSSSSDPLIQVNRAIELVQDGFRYLSVNLKLGGQIPASAETVIRRRYGDCKDVAFLLVQTLRLLGISARPVLVDSFWRKSIASMLPSPNVFNHVVVEYQIGDEKRWVDATSKSQGGGALGRSISDFGMGLPIDAETTALVPVPKASLPSGTYELKESFLLDTAGHPSFFAQVGIATGGHADSLRWEFANEGVETVAKRRLQACANRFSWATRVGPLQYRDNREANEFVIAEVFEITGFLKEDRKSNTCPFLIQSDITSETLLSPPLAPRRSPFVLPFPYHVTHTVEIDFTGFNPAAMPPFHAKNQFFNFSRRTKALPKFFKITYTLETLTDSVPPAHLGEHRKLVESVWRESALQIHLPVGYSRMRKRSDFGRLPGPTRTPATAAPETKGKPSPINVLSNPTPPQEIAPTTIVELQPPSTKTVDSNGEPAPGQLTPSPATTRMLAPSSHPSLSPAPSPYRKHGTNKRCLLSLYSVLGGSALMVIGTIVGNAPGADAIAGAILFLCFLIVLGSLILARRGWKECGQPPWKPQRGRSAAAATFVIGGLLGLILFPALIYGFGNMLSRRMNFTGGTLKFGGMNFEFHSPRPPWNQTDERTVGRSTVLAFSRPGPMTFAVNVNALEAGYPNALARVIELAKADFRLAVNSYRAVSEGEVSRKGVTGWQIETEAVHQERHLYIIQWLVATNGFGYQLTIWGPLELKSQIKNEAEPLFLERLPKRISGCLKNN